MKKSIVLSLVASLAVADSFTLGQVRVSDATINENPFEQSVTSTTLEQQNSIKITDSLDKMSGLHMQYSNGARNEASISIRGQDSKRVGLFVDGVPVYVPYDGFVDYNRFLSSDISSIDVSKGFSSVAYGSNTLGGVINIVTKKPTKELEGNLSAQMIWDNSGDLAKKLYNLNVGSKWNNYYVQLSGSYFDQDHFRLSRDYSPALGALQDSTKRLRSEARDQRISLKAGYVADDGSEVAIGYINQKGTKQAPPSTASTSPTNRDKWTWPHWDKESVYVVAQKNLDSSYLKGSIYYDKLDNELDYDYTQFNDKFNNFSGSSRYDDYSYGARAEYGITLGDNLLVLSANYKYDSHEGYQINQASHREYIAEKFADETYSLGAEDTLSITDDLELIAGVGYDYKKTKRAYDTTSSAGTGWLPQAVIPALEKGSQDSINPQAALVYSLDESQKVRASFSQKSYLPSIKDRYSRRMGSAIANPDLDAEVANHYELSYNYFSESLNAKVAGFFTKNRDAIQDKVVDYINNISQNVNIGKTEYKGFELDASYRFSSYEVGGNYSYIDYENKTSPAVKITKVPKHKLFLYADAKISGGFGLYADAKYKRDTYEDIGGGVYQKLPTHTIIDLRAYYEPTQNIIAEIGVKNLTDKLETTLLNYPDAGREFYIKGTYKF